MPEHSREDAYRLDSPTAHQEYYDAWAVSYDDDFIAATGYAVPAAVARAFMRVATPGDTPVADVGCGTGQVGRALQRPDVDGFDISPGMLVTAAATGAYRNLHRADLSESSISPLGMYGGLVSSGTFTHGHLGPVELAIVLRLGRAGALCVIGINAEHYRQAEFDLALTSLQDSGEVNLLDETELPSYDQDSVGTNPEEPVNRTVIVTFRLSTRGERRPAR